MGDNGGTFHRGVSAAFPAPCSAGKNREPDAFKRTQQELLAQKAPAI